MATLEKVLLAAQGYSELGMHDDALAELDSLPEEEQHEYTVVEARTQVHIGAKKWEPALATAVVLCKEDPVRPTGFIHAAFCLHELGRTEEARNLLLEGPLTLHREPTFHYNMACYECRLGQLDVARAHLEKSFQLDKHFRQLAKSDPDLVALRP